MISPNTAGVKKWSCGKKIKKIKKNKKFYFFFFNNGSHECNITSTSLPESDLGFFVRGHPEEGQENRLVDGPLHVSHGRRQRQRREVKAAWSLVEVRVQTPLQGLIKHHLVGGMHQYTRTQKTKHIRYILIKENKYKHAHNLFSIK